MANHDTSSGRRRGTGQSPSPRAAFGSRTEPAAAKPTGPAPPRPATATPTDYQQPTVPPPPPLPEPLPPTTAALDGGSRSCPPAVPCFRKRTTVLANGKAYPYFQVAARKYRFRIVDTSNLRSFALRPADGSEIVQIGSDDGLLERANPTAVIVLSPGEHADVVVDFSRYQVGTQIVLENAALGGATAQAVGQVLRFDLLRTGHRHADAGRDGQDPGDVRHVQGSEASGARGADKHPGPRPHVQPRPAGPGAHSRTTVTASARVQPEPVVTRDQRHRPALRPLRLAPLVPRRQRPRVHGLRRRALRVQPLRLGVPVVR